LPPRLREAMTRGDSGKSLEPDGIEHASLLSAMPITVNVPSGVPD
jgi:hypothetical protein